MTCCLQLPWNCCPCCCLIIPPLPPPPIPIPIWLLPIMPMFCCCCCCCCCCCPCWIATASRLVARARVSFMLPPVRINMLIKPMFNRIIWLIKLPPPPPPPPKLFLPKLFMLLRRSWSWSSLRRCPRCRGSQS